MELFDAHCHLQDARLGAETERIVQEARRAGVQGWVCNGTQPKDWERVDQLASQVNGVVASYGLHPWFVEQVNEGKDGCVAKDAAYTKNEDDQEDARHVDPLWLTQLSRRLSRDPNACVGEAGLDFANKHAPTKERREQQREALRQQMRLARTFSRPISLHCVRAHAPILELLKEEGPFPRGVLIHGYLGPPECIRNLVQAGSSFSLGGHLTRIPEHKAQAIVRSIPTECLMLETDCPDGLLKNDVQEGPSNHPRNLRKVLGMVAKMRGMEDAELADISCKNARTMFVLSG